jgi:hypothetical protein
LIHIAKLQVDWDSSLIDVFERTPQQMGDTNLLRLWENQVEKIILLMRENLLSGIPGQLDEQVVWPAQPNDQSPETGNPLNPTATERAQQRSRATNPTERVELDEENQRHEDDDLGEDEYNNDIDQVAQQTMERVMLDNLAHASSVG